MKTHYRTILAAVACVTLAASLTACGGGGGDDPQDNSTTTVNGYTYKTSELAAASTDANHVDRVTIKWAGGKIPVYYMPAGAPPKVSKDAAIGYIQNAAALWSVACGANLYYAGELVAGSPRGIIIGWGVPTVSIAAAETQSKVTSGDPVTTRIVIDNEEDGWGGGWYKGNDEYIARVLSHTILHEMGHAMGLGHTDDKGDVMYPSNQEDGGITDADSTACKVY